MKLPEQATKQPTTQRRFAPADLATRMTALISESATLAALVVYIAKPRRYQALSLLADWEAVLEALEQRIEADLRQKECYARLSEEKFCIVLPAIPSTTHAVLTAVRLLAVLRDTAGSTLSGAPLQASAGIALFPDHARSVDQLVACAETAAGAAIHSEDGFQVYRPEDGGETSLSRGQIERELANAIHQNELPVYYQPQVAISNGRCVGAEALLRWAMPGGVSLPVSTVISVAEETGLIEPLTVTVINTVLRHAAEMAREDMPINVSVNLSSKLLSQRELPEIVQQAVDTWQVPAKRLTLEITESAMIGDVEGSIALLCRLREMGVKISIDDFGTGYSSLGYLKRIPLHELKIDRTFVAGLMTSDDDKGIVQVIIDLAHSFGLQSVAEGVEDLATLQTLGEMGCDLAQGYLFSRPMSYAELVTWKRQWSGSPMDLAIQN